MMSRNKGDNNGGDGEGFLPRFGVGAVVGAVGFAIIIYTSKEKKEV